MTSAHVQAVFDNEMQTKDRMLPKHSPSLAASSGLQQVWLCSNQDLPDIVQCHAHSTQHTAPGPAVTVKKGASGAVLSLKQRNDAPLLAERAHNEKMKEAAGHIH